MNGTSQKNSTFSSLFAGDYLWSVQDSFGCVFNSTVTITQPSGSYILHILYFVYLFILSFQLSLLLPQWPQYIVMGKTQEVFLSMLLVVLDLTHIMYVFYIFTCPFDILVNLLMQIYTQFNGSSSANVLSTILSAGTFPHKYL